MTDPMFIITYGNGDDAYVRLNRENLVNDICDGQIEDINQILHCLPSRPGMRGFCVNATIDIAEDVRAEKVRRRELPSWQLASWLETQLGVGTVEAAE